MCLALLDSGLWLHYAAKFDPFLSLDCARVEDAKEEIKFYHLATLTAELMGRMDEGWINIAE